MTADPDIDALALDRALARLADAARSGADAQSNADPRFAASEAIRAITGWLGMQYQFRAADRDATPETILQRHGLSYRTVSLKEGWWREDCGHLLGFYGASFVPVGIRRRRGGYEVRLPGAGSARRVGREIAQHLQPACICLVPTIPDAQPAMAGLARLLWPALREGAREAVAPLIAAGLCGLLLPTLAGGIFGIAIRSHDQATLVALCGGVLALTLSRLLFGGLASVAIIRALAAIETVAQAAIWERLLRLPAAFFQASEDGDLCRSVNGILDMRLILSVGLIETMLGGASALLGLPAVVINGGWIGLCCLGFVALVSAAASAVCLGTIGSTRELLAAQGALSGFSTQMLRMAAKLKVAGAQRRALVVWLRFFSPTVEIASRLDRRYSMAALMVTELPLLTSTLAFAMVGSTRSPFGTGQFIALNVALGQAVAGFAALTGSVPILVAASQHLRRLSPVLEPQLTARQTDSGPALSGHIRFENIVFSYQPGGRPALDGVSLDVPAGKMLAVVGPSGAGKSSLIRLLLGFETQQAGRILLDGHDLRHLDLAQVRLQIGSVMQNAGLLNGSLYQNIASATSLSEDEVWDAAIMAGLADDIRAMPMGLHTIVSEDGAVLSGGQRQRLMLARAVARRPRILLLDEATSALDNRTQAAIVDRLNGFGISRMVVAHRLSTVRRADQIIVLDRGKVAERGTFDELIDAGGLFARLASRQR